MFQGINIPRKKILVIIFILFLPTLVWLITQRTFVNIKITDQADDVSVFYTIDGENPEKIKPGLNIVKPGLATINITTGSKQSLLFKEVKVLRSNTVRAQLAAQKEGKKVVGNLKSKISCISGDDSNIITCQDSRIYQQSTRGGITHSSMYPNQRIVDTAVPFEDGYLSIVDDVSSNNVIYKLVYTTPTTQTLIDSGDKLRGGEEGDSKIFTSDNGKRFIITNPRTNSLILYNGLKDKSPLTTKLNDEFSSYPFSELAVSFSDTSLSIAYPIEEPNNTDDVMGGANAHVRLFRYDISNTITEKENHTLKLGHIGGQIRIYENTLLVLGQDDYLRVFDIEGNKPRIKASVPRVDHVVLDGANIFYTSQKAVYEFNKNELRADLLRQLPNINEAALLVLNGRPVLVGNTNNSPTTFGAYVVLDEENTDTVDLFNLIPYNPNVLPLINSEYIGNDIYFSVDLKSLIIDRDTGGITYNNAEFEQKKKIITARLKADGVDLKKYKLHFNPGP